MDILVTGGAGAIGTFAVEELVERGHAVTVFDLQDPDVPDASSVEGDVTDGAALRSPVREADAVLHLASLLPPACEEDPVAAHDVNVGGTLNVLDAAVGAGTRVVCLSSKATLGAITGVNAHPTYEPVGESHPTNPFNVYGATKLAVEHYCQAYARNHDLDVAFVRLASTWGPGKGARHGELDLLSRLVESAARGDPISAPGGDQRNDLLYYGDIGRGLADLATAPELTYLAYHLGSGTTATLRDVADALAAVCGTEPTVEDGLDYYGQPETTYCRMDIARARDDVGYEPVFDVRKGVEDYLERIDALP